MAELSLPMTRSITPFQNRAWICPVPSALPLHELLDALRGWSAALLSPFPYLPGKCQSKLHQDKAQGRVICLTLYLEAGNNCKTTQ